MLREVEPEPLSYPLPDVNAALLIYALADTLAEMEGRH